MIMTLGRVLINAGLESALGANRTRRDGGNDVNDPQRSSGRIRRTKRYGISDRNCCHCGLMLAATITLPHFPISSAISFPNSAGDPGSATPPRPARRAFILGSSRAALTSLLSFSTISAGVAFGAQTPNHALAS